MSNRSKTIPSKHYIKNEIVSYHPHASIPSNTGLGAPIPLLVPEFHIPWSAFSSVYPAGLPVPTEYPVFSYLDPQGEMNTLYLAILQEHELAARSLALYFQDVNHIADLEDIAETAINKMNSTYMRAKRHQFAIVEGTLIQVYGTLCYTRDRNNSISDIEGWQTNDSPNHPGVLLKMYYARV